MDQNKMGSLIRTLRTEQGMTRLTLARALDVTDRAVSKWERGLGCPDVSLLPQLARPLRDAGVDRLNISLDTPVYYICRRVLADFFAGLRGGEKNRPSDLI